MHIYILIHTYTFVCVDTEIEAAIGRGMVTPVARRHGLRKDSLQRMVVLPSILTKC